MLKHQLNSFPTEARMQTAPFKRILVTTDLSEDANAAYPFAISMARLCNAQLTLLTCVDTSIQFSATSPDHFEFPVAYDTTSREELRRSTVSNLSEHAKKFFPGIAVQTNVIDAPIEARQSIVTTVEEGDFDLVIMASHGRSGFKRAILGSVTEHVLRHSRVPVLVIPVKEHHD